MCHSGGETKTKSEEAAAREAVSVRDVVNCLIFPITWRLIQKFNCASITPQFP